MALLTLKQLLAHDRHTNSRAYRLPKYGSYLISSATKTLTKQERNFAFAAEEPRRSFPKF